MTDTRTGPLAGIRILELASIGPAPQAAMMLADLGADVVRVERHDGGRHGHPAATDWLLRGRRSIALDLKDPGDLDTALHLVEKADVLIEGSRPGVAERLGIGPGVCLERNPGLVYARMTGWGQEGPRAHTAGHDINYLSITGALHAIGAADSPPPPPLNLIADVAGGAMLLISGVLSALLDRERTGEGQVVDVAMVDGVSVGLQMLWALRSQGMWTDHRGANFLDGAAPFYRSYACSDSRYMAVGAIEPEFYDLLVEKLGLDPGSLPDRNNPMNWAALTEVFAAKFAQKTREEWTAVFAGTDACVTPVLTFEEAAEDPHLKARGSIITLGGVTQGGPAPRFSRHTQPVPTDPPGIDEDRAEILADWLGAEL